MITPLLSRKNNVSTLISDMYSTISYLKTFIHHVARKWGKHVKMSHKSPRDSQF